LILPLTSLRFVAAILVVLQHYAGFAAGHAGVSFFYVLSGFVLALNNADKVETWPERRRFWVRRVARIYPTHLLTLALTVPLLGIAWSSLPLNVLLLHSWVPREWVYFGYNGPSWSISNEAFFYALFPFLVAMARPKLLAIWGLALLALAAAASILLPGTTLQDPTIKFAFYIFPLTRLLEFMLGIALARLPTRRPLHIGAELGALALAGLGLALVYAPPPGAFAGSLIFIPGAVALVYVFANSRGPLAKLLSLPLLVLLGEASFALYMLHVPLKLYVPEAPWYLGPLAVLLSVLVYKGFELPMQKLVLRTFRANQPLSKVKAEVAAA